MHHLLFAVPLYFFSLTPDNMKHRTEELIHIKTYLFKFFSFLSSFVLTLFWWLLCSGTVVQTFVPAKGRDDPGKDIS